MNISRKGRLRIFLLVEWIIYHVTPYQTGKPDVITRMGIQVCDH